MLRIMVAMFLASPVSSLDTRFLCLFLYSTPAHKKINPNDKRHENTLTHYDEIINLERHRHPARLP